MAIHDYQINKIESTVDKRGVERVDVKESFSIKEVKKLDDKRLEIIWGFDIDYKQIGKLSMQGSLIYGSGSLADQYEEKEVQGKKVLALKGDALIDVSNFILRRGLIEAIVLAKIMQLPAPIQLPSVKIQKSK